MRKIAKKIGLGLFVIVILVVAFFTVLQERDRPAEIQYGVSFNTLYARELGLEPREVFDAILNDLGVRHFRLATHWDMVEPAKDVYDFSEIDYQMSEARRSGADVILGVGRRLPRWPECHVPEWAIDMSWEDQKKEILAYMETVVNRYKDYDNILYWQVENEPYLEIFAKEHCGELDEDFLDEEIALVKSLDPLREVLITDSGNLGTWAKPYKKGDLFGTSVYVYLWNPDIGPFKSLLPPAFYRAKTTLMEILFGKKESLLIELSLEPWLLQPVITTSKEIQLERMDIEKFNEIINFAKKTRFEKQYLWGAEWWYFMNQHGYEEFWERGKEIFSGE